METVNVANKIKKIILLLLVTLALPLIGCSKEGFYEGMYRGLAARGDCSSCHGFFPA